MAITANLKTLFGRFWKKPERRRFELAARATSDCIWEWNLVNDKVWRNIAYKTFFGHPTEQIVSDRSFWRQNCHPDDYEATVTSFKAALSRKDKFWSGEYRFRRADGSYAAVYDRGFLFYDAAGVPQRAIGAIEDISRRKSYEEKLFQEKKAAEASNNEKSQFIGKLTTEARSPLAVIRGFGELMKQRPLDFVQQQKYAAILVKNCDQLVQLVNHAFAISKLELSQDQLKMDRHNLREFLKDIEQEFLILARERNLTFEVDLRGKLPEYIYIDLRKIREVVRELLWNAFKFTKQGGIRLSCHASACKSTVFKLFFTVTDTGPGFSREEVGNLFSPFERGDPTRGRQDTGCGLGLYLCQKLVSKLAGTLTLEHAGEGFGACFKVEVNAGSVLSTPSFTTLPSHFLRIANERSHQIDLAGRRILFVDDSEHIRELMNSFLRKAGAEVDCAENGFEGYDKAMAGNHDIVIMDLNMPLRDGYQVTSQLRSSGYEKPIIALTASVLDSLQERCEESGFNDYLLKPIQRDLLLEKIYSYTQPV